MSKIQNEPGEISLKVIGGTRPNGAATNLQTGLRAELWEVTDAGVIIKATLPREDWLALAAKAIGDFEYTRDGHLVAMLRVGDVLAYGEREYGEEYTQAIDSTRKAIRLSVKTLQNVQWICGSVKPETRHLMLTLSHHEAVAKLTDEEQKSFLQIAEDEELSVAELKKRIKEAHPNEKKKTKTRKAIIDLDSEDGLLHAAEKVLEFMEALEVKPDEWDKDRQARWFPTVTRLFAFFGAAEEVSREGAKVVSAYLDNPDNGPVKAWSDTRKKKWGTQLNEIAKAARRMGVSTCRVAKSKPAETPAADGIIAATWEPKE